MERRKWSRWCILVARLIGWWNVGQSVPKWWLAVWKSPTVALPAGQIRFRLGCWPQYQPNGCTCKCRHTHNAAHSQLQITSAMFSIFSAKCTIFEHRDSRTAYLGSQLHQVNYDRRRCKRPLRNGSQTAAAVTRANGHCVKIASLKRYWAACAAERGAPKKKTPMGWAQPKGLHT